VEILRLRLDVEPLPHKGFRPGELQMNKQGTASRSKTEQTEQQDPAQIELKPSKYLALLVALFPHVSYLPVHSNGRIRAPLYPSWGPKQGRARPRRKESSNPAQISAHGKILIPEAANPGPNRPTAEYRGQMLELVATAQPRRGIKNPASLGAGKNTATKSFPSSQWGRSNECLPPLRSAAAA